jgi:hypothetical protein
MQILLYSISITIQFYVYCTRSALNHLTDLCEICYGKYILKVIELLIPKHY